MQCFNCKSEVDSFAKVCPFCKQPHPTNPVALTLEYMDCPHCNTKIKKGITKCPSCSGVIKYTSAIDGLTGKGIMGMLAGMFIISYLICWGIAAYFFESTSHFFIFILSVIGALYGTFSSKAGK